MTIVSEHADLNSALTEKILTRIEKLLKLANSSNQHEAASAAARAVALMNEHQIEEATIRARLEDDSGSPVELEEIEVGAVDGFIRPTMERWIGILFNAITTGFGLHGHWTNVDHGPNGETKRDRWGRLKTWTGVKLIGKASTVKAGGYLFRYLVSETERLCETELGDLGRDERPTTAGGVRAWRNAYKLACARVIYERLSEQRKDAIRAAATAPSYTPGVTTAIAVINRDKAELDGYYKRYSKAQGLRSAGGWSANVGNPDASARGSAAGQSINLASGGKGLGSGAKQLKGS